MTGGVRDREELREHRAGIPIDVTEPALPVPPAGPPRDTGDDDDGSVAAGRRPDPHEGVILRVIPVHAGWQVGTAVGHRDVELEREPPARGTRGAEQPRRALPELPSLRVTVKHHGAHDAGGQVQQPREVREVDRRGGDLGGAGEHAHGRRRRGRKVAGERHPGQVLPVPLVEPRQAIQVVDLEVPQHPRVVDGYGPHEVGLVAGGLVPAPGVGREPVQRLRRGFHASTIAERALVPCCVPRVSPCIGARFR